MTGPEDEAWLDRYSRQIMLDQIGYEGQRRLSGSSALVVGAGGLGTVVLERLAGMGVGRITVVDRDVVEESNLHRQTLYGDADVGRPKAVVAAERVRSINSGIKAVPVAASLSDGNAHGLVEGCDVAIDALDTAGARYVLNRACVRAGVPLVCGSAVGMEGQAMTVLPGRTACYRCVFGEVDDDTMPKCSTTGVHPSILSVIGGIETSEAASIMAGREPTLAGRLFHASLDGLEFAKMGVSADPDCPACGSSAARAGGGPEKGPCPMRGRVAVEELCGRGRGKRTFAVSGCQCSECCECGDAAGPEFQSEAVADRIRAAGMGVVVGRNGEIAGVSAGGGVRISVVGQACAIVVGAESADAAGALYGRIAGSRGCSPAGSGSGSGAGRASDDEDGR